MFDENKRLMIQPLREIPERLLKQNDGSSAMRSSPAAHISFVMWNGHATTMKLDSPGFPLAGVRIRNGDVKTFRAQTR
ncbi:MAG TPA: hypothetical protein VHV32_03850 [Candidatus Angelobacter sp.]|nr:hypothetical protein [Candidatus Angelobacter sp.]